MTSVPTFARASCFAMMAGTAACAALAAPPVAPVRDVVETLHGVTVHDPYRYFENRKDLDVQTWLQGQGAFARETLDRIDGRLQMEKRIADLSAASGDVVTGITRMPGGLVYYQKRGRSEKQFKLVLRAGLARSQATAMASFSVPTTTRPLRRASWLRTSHASGGITCAAPVLSPATAMRSRPMPSPVSWGCKPVMAPPPRA